MTKLDLRYGKGQKYVPRQGPHRYHWVTVVGTKAIDGERDRVTVSCECGGAFRFVDHWGRWS